MEKLDERVALVTGGGATVGFLIAQQLARAGARVMLTDRNFAKAEQRAAICREQGLDVRAFPLNVTREDEWISTMIAARRDYGGLNILVHTATTVALRDFEEMSVTEWRLDHAVNLEGVFIGTKYALPLMAATGNASIIMTSPVVGAPGHHKFTSYFSSKAGVMMLMQAVALHCASRGYDIRCNAVQTSFVNPSAAMKILDEALAAQTSGSEDFDDIVDQLVELMPIGLNNMPDDFIAAVVYLASDASRMLNGKELTVAPSRVPA